MGSDSDESVVACPACGKPLDALRAGHVAVLDGGFRYFCDQACKRAYVARSGSIPPSEVETEEPPRVAYSPRPLLVPDAPREPDHPPAGEPEPGLDAARSAPEPAAPPLPARAGLPDPLVAYVPKAIVLIGVVAGLVAPSLTLWGPSTDPARFVLATVAFLACALRAVVVPRDPSDIHPLGAVLSTGAIWGVAIYAREIQDRHAFELAGLAGLVAAFHLLSTVLVESARDGVRSARTWIHERLEQPVRVLRGEAATIVPASDVKPGEEILVEAGETFGVDARIVGGAATVTPWIDAPFELKKREGDPIVAGARVVSGSLRAITTWSGPDRAWVKLSDSPRLRPDVTGPMARLVRLGVERGTPIVVILVGAIGMANRASSVEVLAMAAVAAFSLAGTCATGVAALQQARGPISALSFGVVYRDAAAFDAAGRTDIAVLCSRTTLLMGSPEIVALEPLGAVDVETVLAIAAGASTASPHPAQIAVVAAAKARGEPLATVRHATYHPGLGMTALSATGERVVVGNRALLLREKVSVALADGRIAELEGEGKSVTLVALAGKLVGLLALQDGLRPGARAAVQRLLDAGIEPVLLSGEARDTCETIGSALDIEHIRPEVLPGDRGGEVRALADGGHLVAVLGNPADDAAALGAAGVSVALGAAGGTTGDWAIALASDEVRDAGRALALAIDCRDRTRLAAVLALAPAAVAAIGVALGVLPLAMAPLLSFSGVAAAVVHARR